MTTLTYQSWLQAIRAEHEENLKDDEISPNMEIHRRILASWEQESPKMWKQLKAQGMADILAQVVQQRMWNAVDENLAAGMPITDATEQAERDHLMMEPESPTE